MPRLCPPGADTKNVNLYKYRRISSGSAYYSKEIPGIDELAGIIDELLSPRIISSTKLIALSNSDIWNLYCMLPDLRNEDKVNRLFYLEDGIKDYVSNCIESSNDSNFDDLEKKWQEESSSIARDIYGNLEKIYSLRLGAIALKKYLYPSRTEQVLVKIFRKEK